MTCHTVNPAHRSHTFSALLWLSFVALSVLTIPARGSTTRPNIIFILADDMRWNVTGYAGNRIIRTPNLDRLADEGVNFRNCFATTSICSVSRASIFLGQYVRRHGINDFSKTFSPDQWTNSYPALLRSAGYRTGFIGKFGVGGRKAIDGTAGKFDTWRGLSGQGGRFFIDPQDPQRTHATARFGDQALEFLADSGAGQPFCLSISFNAPHARDGEAREFQPDIRDETIYQDETIPLSPTANPEFHGKLPSFVRESEGRRRWQKRFSSPELTQQTMRDYYRLVAGIDREVGRIRAELEKRDLARQTVIIFTSDNGWFAGDRGLTDKWLMYHESIRLPMIILDPRAPAAAKGAAVEAIALNIDSAPTMLDLAGIPIPLEVQGRSLVPWLTGGKPNEWRNDFFYEHHFAPEIIPPSEGVRSREWSYIRWLKPNPESEELYDLTNDPLESQNLAADPRHAVTLGQMHARWQVFRIELKSPR